MVKSTFITSPYSLEKLLIRLSKNGGLESLEEVMSGEVGGKEELSKTLEQIEEPSNSGILKLLKGELSETVERLAESQNIKVGKLRSTLRAGLSKLLKAKPATASQMTLTSVLKMMVESPSDELLDRLVTLVKDRVRIDQQVSEAGITKTKLIKAIMETDSGTEKPTDDNFEKKGTVLGDKINSPQVKWLKYNLRSKGINESGYAPIMKNEARIVSYAEREYNVDLQKTTKEKKHLGNYILTLEWPPLYELIFGRKEIKFEVDNEYEAETVIADNAVDYLEEVVSIPQASILLPKIKGATTKRPLIKKKKKVNPFLIRLLEDRGVRPIDDILNDFAKREYISEDAISEIVEEGYDSNTEYYYADLFDIIVKGVKNESITGLDKDETDSFSSIINEILEEEDSEDFENDIEDFTTRYEGGGKTLVAIPKENVDFIEAFDAVIADERIKRITTALGIKNPNVSFRSVKPIEGVTPQERGKETVTSLVTGEEIETPKRQESTITGGSVSTALDNFLKTNANRVIYRMSMKGDIDYKDVDYYIGKADARTAFQAYYNMAYLYGSKLQSATEKLNSKINSDDKSEVKKAIEDFIEVLNTELKEFKDNVFQSIQEKVNDIVKDPADYSNEIPLDKDGVSFLKRLERILIIKKVDTDITEV